MVDWPWARLLCAQAVHFSDDVSPFHMSHQEKETTHMIYFAGTISGLLLGFTSFSEHSFSTLQNIKIVSLYRVHFYRRTNECLSSNGSVKRRVDSQSTQIYIRREMKKWKNNIKQKRKRDWERLVLLLFCYKELFLFCNFPKLNYSFTYSLI